MAAEKGSKRGFTQQNIYWQLRDEIVSLVLVPGTVISTQETADRLGASRTPVREAFIRLQRENLLEVTPQKATVVSHIDTKRVWQERFVREALEVENLDRFMEIVNEDILEVMRQNLRQQKLAMEEKRYVDYIKLDNAFHLYALLVTGEELGAEVVGQLNGHYDRIRLLTAMEEHIAFNAIGEHARLIESYEKRDLELAKTLLRAHLQQLRIQETVLKKTRPAFFKE